MDRERCTWPRCNLTSSLLPESPALTIQREGNNVVIRWPASATGYALQSSASLSAPSWSAVAGAPEVDGSFLKTDGANRERSAVFPADTKLSKVKS